MMPRPKTAARLTAIAVVCAGMALAQSPPASLKISGAVSSPVKLTAGELAAMPHQTVAVKGEDGITVRSEGVPLREVLARAGAPLGKGLRGKALASYILAIARDGYQVVFALGELDPAFANESILVAGKRDSKPLSSDQGPFRPVCPNDKAGARSVRMLETLEVVRLRP